MAPLRTLALLLLAVPTLARAQRPPVDSTRDTSHRRWRSGLALAAATAATMSLDVRLANAMRAPAVQHSSTLHGGAGIANLVGDPGAALAAAALYGTGRLRGDSGLTALGLHAGEAVAIGGGVSGTIKWLTGRQRPSVATSDADEFAPAQGVRAGRSSFPSGHTTAAFAFAGAVGTEWRRTHPNGARVGVPLLYAGATSVGLARMYTNHHWASDVVLGAGIGTLVGRAVVTHDEAPPFRWLERHLGALTGGPSPSGGVALGIRHATR